MKEEKTLFSGSSLQTQVRTLHVTAEQADRRIDNLLLGEYKGLPRTRVYRLLRKGEVRVNGGRVKPFYRLRYGDKVRLPPVYLERRSPLVPTTQQRTLFTDGVLYEDDAFLVLDKRSGMPVHGGTRHRYGVIELLRVIRCEGDDLELVHRLDKGTSGCLLIAKRSSALRHLHTQMRNGQIKKTYQALLCGRLEQDKYDVKVAVGKHSYGQMEVDDNRLWSARSIFNVKRRYSWLTWVRVQLFTGRMHQIRLHARHLGCPVAGDERYGDQQINSRLRRIGLQRLFLHAAEVSIISPVTQKRVRIVSPLPLALQEFLSEDRVEGISE